jgi:hypothetical protein
MGDLNTPAPPEPSSILSNANSDRDKPAIYQIRLESQLDSQWTDWFGGLAITLAENGDTLLTGAVADQAALHGLLRKVRDIGMPLLSLIRLAPGQAASEVQRHVSKRGEI